jgi:hypothetical protein
MDLANLLMTYGKIVNVTASAAERFHDDDTLYRLQEDVKSDVLNRKKRWVIHAARHPAVVMRALTELLDPIVDAATAVDGRTLDLHAIIADARFRTFELALCELQHVDLTLLTTLAQKMCFWINAYNVLVLHGRARVGHPLTALQRRSFFNDLQYEIAGVLWSLNDIEHGVLRGNSAPPGSLGRHQFSKPLFGSPSPPDALKLSQVIIPRDPRVHFTLNCGAMSCPAFSLYHDDDDIDAVLNYTAERFVDGDLQVDVHRKDITISRIFSWYSSDFGESEFDVLCFIARFVTDPLKQSQLDALLKKGKYSVRFHEYDWSASPRSTGSPLASSAPVSSSM